LSSLALAAILASAVIHAGWNALLKQARDSAAASLVITALAAALTALYGLAGGPLEVPAAGWPWIIAAGLVEGAYFVTLGRALAHLPLGTAYGISRGAGLLLVWPLSVALLGEALAPPELAGAALVALGLLVLAERAGSRAGLLAAWGCAVTIGLYPVTYKGALERGVSPAPLFALALALSLPIQLALLGRGRGARLAAALRDTPVRTVAAAALCAGSFMLFLVALKTGGATRITGLRNTSVVFAALFGWALGEPRAPRTLGSALAIAVGAVLLGW
jgi:drug/metabolite transporter (DMT)-like permease